MKSSIARICRGGNIPLEAVAYAITYTGEREKLVIDLSRRVVGPEVDSNFVGVEARRGITVENS
jgi:hypothetical protein